jgi:hypothetical protein
VGASERATTRIDQNVIAITAISLAEELRRLAEWTKPGHGNVPLLDREKTWKVPNSFPFCSIKIEDWLKVNTTDSGA